MLSGIMASLLLPIVTIRYNVELPVTILPAAVSPADESSEVTAGNSSVSGSMAIILSIIYLAGVFFIISRMTAQVITLVKAARKNRPAKNDRTKDGVIIITTKKE